MSPRVLRAAGGNVAVLPARPRPSRRPLLIVVAVLLAIALALAVTGHARAADASGGPIERVSASSLVD